MRVGYCIRKQLKLSWRAQIQVLVCNYPIVRQILKQLD